MSHPRSQRQTTLRKPHSDKFSVRAIAVGIAVLASLFTPTMYGASNAVLPFCLVALVFDLVITRGTIRIRAWHILLLLLWVVFVVSTEASPLVEVERDIWTFLIAVLFVIVATGLNYARRDLALIWGTYIAAATIGSVTVLHNVWTDNQVVWNRYSTSAFGVGRDPNYAAAFLVGVVPLLLILLLTRERSPVITIGLLGLNIAGVIGTGSRAGVIVLGLVPVMAFFWLTRMPRHKLITVRWRLIASAVIIVLAIMVLLSHSPESMVDRLTGANSLTRDESRMTAWAVAIGALRERPVLGLGLNGGNAVVKGAVGINSHSVYVDILVGAGLIGFLVFVCIVFMLGKVAPPNRLVLGSIMVGLFGPLMFINGFNTLTFWVPVLITGVSSEYARSPNNSLLEVFCRQSPDTHRGGTEGDPR